jgi:lysophospholipase L1-like esterase
MLSYRLVLSLSLLGSIACSASEGVDAGDASVTPDGAPSATVVQSAGVDATTDDVAAAAVDGAVAPADAGPDVIAAPDAGDVDAAPVCPICPVCTLDAGPVVIDASSSSPPSRAFPLLVDAGRTLNVVADGDSRVLDAYLPDGGAPWPQLAGLLAGPEVVMHNVAQAGSNTSYMLQRGPTNVDPLYDPSATRNIIVAMIGVNDIRAFTSTSQLSAPEANLEAYGVARMAKGWELYLVVDLPAGAETRAVWEGWVAFERGAPAASTPFATGVFELGDPFDDFTGGVDKRWSQDGIHPSQAGCVRIADIVGHKLGQL